MVFVKVRETYDLHTTKNKMTVIGIHTPKPDIIKKNYPGLLMQCRAYRPVSADVRLACASVLPLDPKGVGLSENDVAPEDIFNPILYKAMSNKGMSQLEARINAITSGLDVEGSSANAEVDNFVGTVDHFSVYYGLLSNTHDWKHANPQSGLSMTKLKPYVYDLVVSQGDSKASAYAGDSVQSAKYPGVDGDAAAIPTRYIIGNAKPFPYLNCTSYTVDVSEGAVVDGWSYPGFREDSAKPLIPANAELDVPYLQVFCGCIIVPPSRLHELFYRMVVEWTIEFSSIRPLCEITDWLGLERLGGSTHYQNYSYEATKEAVTGSDKTILDGDSCMVSSNVDVNKVM